MKKVLGMGEIMIQMNPTEKGSLVYQNLFERHVAGSEANTIIQMQKLDIDTNFITAVGSKEFGEIILSTLRAEGVGVKDIKIDDEHPTGLYVVQRSYPFPEKTSVIYYRKGAAASFFSEEDLKEDSFKDIDMFLVSGITPALSEISRKTALKAIKIAKKNGVKVVFDTNIRINLLKTSEKAYDCLLPFIETADILFTGKGDLNLLFGKSFEENFEEIKKIGKRKEMYILKLGGKGAMVIQDDKVYRSAPFKVPVIDELGAGDSFDGTFLAALLKGKSIEESLKYASAAGAITVSLKGDIEPLPHWKDLELFLELYESGEGKLLR